MGLLTKSYFLVLVPFVFGVLFVLARRCRMPFRNFLIPAGIPVLSAGPWYARNLVIYHNLSGMQETMGGIPLRALVVSAIHLPWVHSTWTLLVGSLWTGNNSFSTFSTSTLLLLMAGYFVAGGSLACRIVGRRMPASETVLLAGCVTYASALAYSAVITFWSSGGKGISPSPWYSEPIMPIILMALIGELQRTRFGRLAAVWIVTISAYILIATYWLKLIPLYSGFPDGRMTLMRLASWYANPGVLMKGLSAVAMKSPVFILPMAGGVSVAAIALTGFLSRRRSQVGSRTVSGDAETRGNALSRAGQEPTGDMQ